MDGIDKKPNKADVNNLLLSILSIENILLFFSLPVIVPSLLINWFFAKRWGRVDFIIIAIDGFVLLFLTMRSPMFFMLTLFAIITSCVLCFIRHNKLKYGIFLGYSNSVANRLMIGGVLFLIGFWGFFPWGPLNQLAGCLSFENKYKTVELISNRLKYSSKIFITDGKPIWDKKLYLCDFNGTMKFSPFLPGEEITVTEPSKLWEDVDELIGQRVNLTYMISSNNVISRTGFEYQLINDGKKLYDNNTRFFALVPETEGRVWVISEKILSSTDPEISKFYERMSFKGTVVKYFCDKDQARWYYSKTYKNMPYMGVTILPDSQIEEKPINYKVISTWVPLENSSDEIWAVFPGEKKPDKTGDKIRGFYEGKSPQAEILSGYLADNTEIYKNYNSPRAINCISVSEFINQNKLVLAVMSGFKWFFVFFLFSGVFIILWALVKANKE